jgi:hypothetical protein
MDQITSERGVDDDSHEQRVNPLIRIGYQSQPISSWTMFENDG